MGSFVPFIFWMWRVLASIGLPVISSSEAGVADLAAEGDCRCWAGQGQCQENPDFMSSNCAASCSRHAQCETCAEEVASLRARLQEAESCAEEVTLLWDRVQKAESGQLETPRSVSEKQELETRISDLELSLAKEVEAVEAQASEAAAARDAERSARERSIELEALVASLQVQLEGQRTTSTSNSGDAEGAPSWPNFTGSDTWEGLASQLFGEDGVEGLASQLFGEDGVDRLAEKLSNWNSGLCNSTVSRLCSELWNRTIESVSSLISSDDKSSTTNLFSWQVFSERVFNLMPSYDTFVRLFDFSSHHTSNLVPNYRAFVDLAGWAARGPYGLCEQFYYGARLDQFIESIRRMNYVDFGAVSAWRKATVQRVFHGDGLPALATATIRCPRKTMNPWHDGTNWTSREERCTDLTTDDQFASAKLHRSPWEELRAFLARRGLTTHAWIASVVAVAFGKLLFIRLFKRFGFFKGCQKINIRKRLMWAFFIIVTCLIVTFVHLETFSSGSRFVLSRIIDTVLSETSRSINTFGAILEEVGMANQIIILCGASILAFCSFKRLRSFVGLTKMICVLWLVVSFTILHQLCREASTMLGHQVCYEEFGTRLRDIFRDYIQFGVATGSTRKATDSVHYGWASPKRSNVSPLISSLMERVKLLLEASRITTISAAADGPHIAIAAYAEPRCMIAVLCFVVAASILCLKRLRLSTILPRSAVGVVNCSKATGDDVVPEVVNVLSGEQFFIGDDDNMTPQPIQQFFIGDDDMLVEAKKEYATENYIVERLENNTLQKFAPEITVPAVSPHEISKEAAQQVVSSDGDSVLGVSMSESSVHRRIRIAGLSKSRPPVAPEDERGELSPRAVTDSIQNGKSHASTESVVGFGHAAERGAPEETPRVVSPSKTRPRPPPLSIIV